MEHIDAIAAKARTEAPARDKRDPLLPFDKSGFRMMARFYTTAPDTGAQGHQRHIAGDVPSDCLDYFGDTLTGCFEWLYHHQGAAKGIVHVTATVEQFIVDRIGAICSRPVARQSRILKATAPKTKRPRRTKAQMKADGAKSRAKKPQLDTATAYEVPTT